MGQFCGVTGARPQHKCFVERRGCEVVVQHELCAQEIFLSGSSWLRDVVLHFKSNLLTSSQKTIGTYMYEAQQDFCFRGHNFALVKIIVVATQNVVRPFGEMRTLDLICTRFRFALCRKGLVNKETLWCVGRCCSRNWRHLSISTDQSHERRMYPHTRHTPHT